MRIVTYIIGLLLVVGCAKPPSPPGPVSLIAPAQNLECTTGTLVSSSLRTIDFRWAKATATDNYLISVTNLSNASSYSKTVTSTTTQFTLPIRAAYSWSVRASNGEVTEVSTSDLWYFFNPGAEVSHVPYQAAPTAPVPGSRVDQLTDGTVLIKWIGADSDSDITRYQLYVDTVNPPANQVALDAALSTQYAAVVTSGLVYYWYVVTSDALGNSSTTPVYDFRVN